MPLKDLKESYPVQVSLFGKTRGLLEEPEFSWWTPYVLKKAEHTISKVKAHLKETTHKYGIEIPKNTNHAKELDTKNVNTLWMNALKTEMKNFILLLISLI